MLDSEGKERKTRVCLMGLGRTGREVANALLEQKDMDVAAVFVRRGSEKCNQDLGKLLGKEPLEIMVRGIDTLDAFLRSHQIDVAVDFSQPAATLESAEIFARHSVNRVVCTTGFNDIEIQKLKSVSERAKTGLVYAPNVTMGVNVLMLLSNLAVSILESYDCAIVEAHFKEKIDAPSGTAKKLAKQLQRSRSEMTEGKENEAIPVQAIRAGGIIGSHAVMIAGEHDMIEIKHESFSRKAFAAGALRAIRFINGRTGYHEMQEVLDIQHVMEAYIQRTAHEKNQLTTKMLEKKAATFHPLG